jgi:FAD synthetase
MEKCSALRREDGSYAPAHALADNRMERAGRCAGEEGGAEQRARLAGMTPTAALVMVGDELLSGRVEDANARFLCRELHALGWHTSRVRALLCAACQEGPCGLMC